MDNVRIDFKNELGEQYVEMRAFKTVPWSLARRLSTIGVEFDEKKTATLPAEQREANDNNKLRLAEQVAIELCVGGDVKNSWTGEPMTFPLNNASVAEAPAELLTLVLSRFGEMREQANPNA